MGIRDKRFLVAYACLQEIIFDISNVYEDDRQADYVYKMISIYLLFIHGI